MVLKRRKFLAGVSMGLAGGLVGFGRKPGRWRKADHSYKARQPLGTARNLIFIHLFGAPSHVDTFDLKPGPFTPNYFGVNDLGGGWLWPSGLMPILAGMRDRFSILRSISAVEAVHTRAVYHMLTSFQENPATIRDVPHFASVISYKLAAEAGAGLAMPAVMMVGRNPAGNGFLPLEHRGVQLSEDGTLPFLSHPFEGGADRLQLLSEYVEPLIGRSGAKTDQLNFQRQARAMMENRELSQLLGVSQDDNPSAITAFRRQCEAAVKVLAADIGTRVFQLELPGWDHHVGIYDRNRGQSLATLCLAFDRGFSLLINELAALPARSGSGTLLDETLIVAMGEFGRTVGALNSGQGRDHFPYVIPAVFAGGGVRGGRLIGQSSADGSYITDRGWSLGRQIGFHDLLATIYSALGIDWGESIRDDESRRSFPILDPSFGPADHITNLFL